MLDEFSKRKLRFVVMPTRFVEARYVKDFEKAYVGWRNVWGQALTEEMNVKDPLYSDNFTRQSHVAALFYGDELFGLVTLNYMNLEEKIYQDDSYFKVWTPDSIQGLYKNAKQIMTLCNVTLNFRFRKNSIGVSGKDLLLLMAVHYLKSQNLDAIVAAVRLEKSMEKSAYRTGAISLAKDLPYSIPGQRVDLVLWSKSIALEKLDPELVNLSTYIWINSSIITDVQTQQGEKNVA